jgi:hypothetical protein
MPQLKTEVLHTFPASLNFLPLESLRFNGALLCAGQTGLFEADEAAWAHDDGGQWRGPAPLRAVPKDLRFLEATANLRSPDFWSAADEIQRVPSATPLTLLWEVAEAVSIGENQTIGTRVVLQSLAMGATVFDAVTTGSRATIPAQAAGCYLALARIATATPAFRLPPEYSRDNARFQYGENSDDYWDWKSNVGKLPPANHEFYDLRAALLNDGAQTDNPEWADYLISGEVTGGEWSARLIIVGDGDIESAPDFIPACGASLYELSDVNTRAALTFDPMARTGNVLKIHSDGRLLIAGQRMTPTGMVAALWQKSGAAYTLLGTNLNPSTGMCECALANHGPTDILETGDGTIFVLTKCSLHRYDPTGVLVSDRLPGTPESTQGHPGGHSLRQWQKRLFFTSENFGQLGFTDASGNVRAQFYDYLVVQQGDARVKGPGTRFHGSNDLANWMNRLWGVMQDKPQSDETARQFITWYDGLDWSFETTLNFKASAFGWQRLIASAGCAGGNRLLTFGKKTGTEMGICGIGTGRDFAWLEFGYRLRRLTLSLADSGEKNSVVMIGRASDESAIDASAWHVLETDATLVYSEGEDELFPEIDDLPRPDENGEEIGVDFDVLVLRRRVGSSPIEAIQVLDAGRERVLENYNKTLRGIWCRIDSDAPADDLASYAIPILYSIWEPLPIAALENVDVLFYGPAGMDWESIVPAIFVRN